MATHHFIPLLGKRIRVTTLDNCGNPPEAADADAYLATNGFVSVSLSAETEDGEEILKKRADGSLCVSKKFSPTFKYFTLDLEFCGVNPSLLSMVTNAEPYEDYEGDVAGFTVASGSIDKQFAFELWTGLAGDACADGAEASGYLLLPFVQAGVVGDIEITGEDSVDFTMTGAYTKDGTPWGKGPYEVVYDDDNTAATLPSPLDSDMHLLLMDTALAPPPSNVDPQNMPS